MEKHTFSIQFDANQHFGHNFWIPAIWNPNAKYKLIRPGALTFAEIDRKHYFGMDLLKLNKMSNWYTNINDSNRKGIHSAFSLMQIKTLVTISGFRQFGTQTPSTN